MTIMKTKIFFSIISFLIASCSKEMTTAQWCNTYLRSALLIEQCLDTPQCTVNKEDLGVLINAKYDYPYCFNKNLEKP